MADTSILRSGFLKEALAKPGRSQTALAKKLGVHPSAVNKIVSGRREVKARELDLIRDYLAETGGPAPKAPSLSDRAALSEDERAAVETSSSQVMGAFGALNDIALLNVMASTLARFIYDRLFELEYVEGEAKKQTKFAARDLTLLAVGARRAGLLSGVVAHEVIALGALADHAADHADASFDSGLLRDFAAMILNDDLRDVGAANIVRARLMLWWAAATMSINTSPAEAAAELSWMGDALTLLGTVPEERN